MVALSHYAKIINNIGFCYFGHAPEYVVALNYLLPIIRQKYPELTISLYVRDEFVCFGGSPESALERAHYAIIKEFKIDPAGDHVIFTFIKDAGLSFPTLPITSTGTTCLICPHAVFPASSFTPSQIETLVRIAHDRGYHPKVAASTDEIDSAAWVVGAENEYVFLAAARGIRSVLMPSGPGTELYRTMFPHGEILL